LRRERERITVIKGGVCNLFNFFWIKMTQSKSVVMLEERISILGKSLVELKQDTEDEKTEEEEKRRLAERASVLEKELEWCQELLQAQHEGDEKPGAEEQPLIDVSIFENMGDEKQGGEEEEQGEITGMLLGKQRSPEEEMQFQKMEQLLNKLLREKPWMKTESEGEFIGNQSFYSPNLGKIAQTTAVKLKDFPKITILPAMTFEKVLEFLTQVRKVKCMGYSDLEVLNTLPMLVTGSVLVVSRILELVDQVNERVTFATVAAILLAGIFGDSWAKKMEKEVRKLEQGKTSAADFAQKLMLYTTALSITSEKLKTFYIDGLRPEIRGYLQLHWTYEQIESKRVTLREMKDKAEVAEELEKQKRTEMMSTIQGMMARVPPTQTPANPMPPRKEFKPIAEVECFICHEKGHYAGSCPKNTQARRIWCYFCGEDGHIKPKCAKLSDEPCDKCGRRGHMAAACGKIDKGIQKYFLPVFSLALAPKTDWRRGRSIEGRNEEVGGEGLGGPGGRRHEQEERGVGERMGEQMTGEEGVSGEREERDERREGEEEDLSVGEREKRDEKRQEERVAEERGSELRRAGGEESEERESEYESERCGEEEGEREKGRLEHEETEEGREEKSEGKREERQRGEREGERDREEREKEEKECRRERERRVTGSREETRRDLKIEGEMREDESGRASERGIQARSRPSEEVGWTGDREQLDQSVSGCKKGVSEQEDRESRGEGDEKVKEEMQERKEDEQERRRRENGEDDRIIFPAILNGVTKYVGYDTAAVSVMDEAAFEAIGGDVVPVEETLCGVIGGATVKVSKRVLVRCTVPKHSAEILFYVIPGRAGLILMSERDGRELGIRVIGLPYLEQQLELPIFDEEWVRDDGDRVEKEASAEDLKKFFQIVQPELDKNAKLPDSTCCTRESAVHEFQMREGPPIFTWQYPIAKAMMQKVHERILKWREMSWIEDAKPGSLWNMPVNPQPKMSGGVLVFDDIRLCMDARKVNKIIQPFEYMLPLIRELVGAVKGAKFISELDLANAFHQILLGEKSREVTAFTDPFDNHRYQWKRMFFGEVGAAAKMQREMEKTLRIGEDEAKDTRAYVDNVLIFHKEEDIEVHARSVARNIALLTADGFKIRPEKCKFAHTRLRTLGHLVSGEAVAVDPIKVAAFLNFERPRTGKQMESLLGFVNFIREYIPMYSMLLGPLEKLRKLKKIEDSNWGEEQQRAFSILKKVLSEAPVIQDPLPGIPLQVGTDASQYGVGAVLYQVVEGRVRYIAFTAKALSGGQKDYPATKRELLGVVLALKRWREYLLGTRFVLETDHKALKYINNAKSHMLRDWAMFLQQFDMEVVHKPGFLNILPHHLSHMYAMLPRDSKYREAEMRMVAALEIDTSSSERVYSRVKEFIRDVVDKKEPQTQNEKEVLVKKAHEASHQGEKGMFDTLFREGVYWKDMLRDCRREAKTCEECLRFNVGKRGFHPLRPISATLPMDHLQWDIAGAFPMTETGFNYVLVVVDVASRYVWLVPLQTKTAEEIVTALVGIVTQFGGPTLLQSDNDVALVNKVVKGLAEAINTELRPIVEYNPEQNGQVENMCREFKQVLNKKLKGETGNWRTLVPWIMWALNRRIVFRTNSSPFSLMLARAPRMGGAKAEELMAEYGEGTMSELVERAKCMKKLVWPAVAREARKRGEKSCEEADAKRRVVKKALKIGDTLMIKRQDKKNKQEERYDGPYKVVQYEQKSKSYRVVDAMGSLVKRKIPRSVIKVIEHKESSDESRWEVEAILGHEGEAGARVYEVKWKGWDQTTMEPEENFDSKECVRAYWKQVGREGGNEGLTVAMITESKEGGAGEKGRRRDSGVFEQEDNWGYDGFGRGDEKWMGRGLTTIFIEVTEYLNEGGEREEGKREEPGASGHGIMTEGQIEFAAGDDNEDEREECKRSQEKSQKLRTSSDELNGPEGRPERDEQGEGRKEMEESDARAREKKPERGFVEDEGCSESSGQGFRGDKDEGRESCLEARRREWRKGQVRKEQDGKREREGEKREKEERREEQWARKMNRIVGGMVQCVIGARGGSQERATRERQEGRRVE
jgi:RNase H-like domain found in reverse transcriptase/Reverse transcriptase (RNA-dependent DNA polymerase)/Integrase core domain/Chromo (CHRromatin Organisation MOdifier) domain/Integrase zinc binding domain